MQNSDDDDEDENEQEQQQKNTHKFSGSNNDPNVPFARNS